MGCWDAATIDWYAETYGDDPTTGLVADAARLGPDDDVIDVGCGTGASLRHLRARGARGRPVGVDPFQRMIGHARARSAGSDIALAVAPAEALPFDNASFDGALAVNSIAHWADRAAGLAELARILRQGGWLVIGGECVEDDQATAVPELSRALAAVGTKAIEDRDIPGGHVTVARKETS